MGYVRFNPSSRSQAARQWTETITLQGLPCIPQETVENCLYVEMLIA